MVSVIVPIYNQAQYINKCLESILKQTYKELEIILVDDGSTDESVQICKKYLFDERITLITQSNYGVSVARNKGLMEATGEWISFIDPDDYIVENYFEKLIAKIDEKTDLIACCCKAFDDSGFYNSFFFESSLEITSDDEKKELYLQLMNGQYRQPQRAFTAIGVPWGKLYRSDVIKTNGLGFNEKLKRQQDNIFNMYFFDFARKIKYLNEPLYLYRLDNVKKYYSYTYNPYAYLYFCEFQMERFKFFHRNNFLNDQDIKDSYCNECLSNVINILKFQLLNPKNKRAYKEKYLDIKKLLFKECFLDGLENLSISKVKGTVRKALFWFIKQRWICGLIIIWECQKVYVYLKKFRSVKYERYGNGGYEKHK